MEGLDLGRSGTAGSLSTSFVGCIFRRPDSLHLHDPRAAPRRAIEPRSGRSCGDKHEDADRLSAFIAFWALMLYREYVEGVTCNSHVHTGRLKRKFCLCCAGRRKGVPSPVFLRMPSEPNLFSRQNSAMLGGSSPLRGSDSAAHSALQIDFQAVACWSLSGPATANGCGWSG